MSSLLLLAPTWQDGQKYCKLYAVLNKRTKFPKSKWAHLYSGTEFFIFWYILCKIPLYWQSTNKKDNRNQHAVPESSWAHLLLGNLVFLFGRMYTIMWTFFVCTVPWFFSFSGDLFSGSGAKGMLEQVAADIRNLNPSPKVQIYDC